jgi:hypothetical protein
MRACADGAAIKTRAASFRPARRGHRRRRWNSRDFGTSRWRLGNKFHCSLFGGSAPGRPTDACGADLPPENPRTGSAPAQFSADAATVQRASRTGLRSPPITSADAYRPAAATTYSITSSARSRIDGDTARPSALAVLTLMTISILTGN